MRGRDLEEGVEHVESVAHGEEDPKQEIDEVAVVEVADAIGHPGAVVVHVENELLGDVVEVGAGRLGLTGPKAVRPVVRPDHLRKEERGGGRGGRGVEGGLAMLKNVEEC